MGCGASKAAESVVVAPQRTATAVVARERNTTTAQGVAAGAETEYASEPSSAPSADPSDNAGPVLSEVRRLEGKLNVDALAFESAARSIVLAPGFFNYTALGRHSERLRRSLGRDKALAKRVGDAAHFEETCAALVQKAYMLR